MTDNHSQLPVKKVIPCDSWDEFKTSIRRDYSNEILGISPLFRGHTVASWKLASPWDRRLHYWATKSVNQRRDRSSGARILATVLGDFKDSVIGLPGVRAKELQNDADWWSLGRHYGLVTPLLDWTKSPYVAAFFAFTGLVERLSPGATTIGQLDPRKFLANAGGHEVAIWSLMLEGSTEDDEDPLDLEIELLLSRVDIGHRQRAQRGVFTILKSNEHFDLESYFATRMLTPPPLTKYLIPGTEAAKAIMELRMMNITFATLYPDLDGAALQANFEMSMKPLMAFSHIPASDLRAFYGGVGATDSQNEGS